MTGGSFLIMGPKHCWIVLHVSILAALLLAINADSEEVTSETQKSEECNPEIRVRRNTVYNATVGQEFRINCTVIFCNNPPPTVSWNKFGETDLLVNSSSNSHIKMEWNMIKELEGITFLVFRNILLSDSGQYQCRTEGDVGHTINITVHDNYETTNVPKINNTTGGSKSNAKISEDILLYVYCAAGIATFVIIVIIISVISMRGCKGKSKKKKKPENQYIELPVVQQPSPRANFQASPRGSPSVPPSRRSTKRKTPPRQTNELRLSRGNEQLYGHMEEDRMRQSNTGQEEASIVYAALNHHQPPRPAARARLQVEENSEYAAIRVA